MSDKLTFKKKPKITLIKKSIVKHSECDTKPKTDTIDIDIDFVETYEYDDYNEDIQNILFDEADDFFNNTHYETPPIKYDETKIKNDFSFFLPSKD